MRPVLFGQRVILDVCYPGCICGSKVSRLSDGTLSTTPSDGDVSLRFIIDAHRILVDEPLSARLDGLSAHRAATITASCVDEAGERFSSWAAFRADAVGTIDVRRHAPVEGSYEGVDPFGLWWSMSSETSDSFATGIAPLPTLLTARLDGSVTALAEAHVERLRMADGICAMSVVENGLVATYFSSPEQSSSPAVVVLGGSGGGFHWSLDTAALLASRGFSALALAYFLAPRLPPSLTEVPLEYVRTAIQWLLARPEVARDEVAIVGASRGAELALLVGATYPEVGSVVALVPSSVVWPAFAGDEQQGRPAWTRQGRPVPHAGFAEPIDDVALAAATIPVERIKGPILVISGGDDRIWPAALFAEKVMRRRRQSGARRLGDVHLHYPDAGHTAGRPPGPPASDGFSFHPVYNRPVATGGTKAANAASSLDAWPRILSFLRAP